MKLFLRTLGRGILKSFTGWNIIWHVLAIVITYAIVVSGSDWQYLVWIRGTTYKGVFFPAIIIGGILPIIVPGALLLVGWMSSKKNYVRVGALLAQAAIAGSIISSIYKAFTGRVQPNIYNLTLDSSREFLFGFWRHGIFWGWPSSHTTIAFASAWALIIAFPKKKVLAVVVLLYALYVGVGVSFNIHCVSESVAGTIIGSVIGIAVGRVFVREENKK